ncbi:MAG TPA: A24 family peptidase, partial [Pirellulales bacterium]
MDEPTQLVPLIIVAVFVLAAALVDMWKLRVYNVLTIPLMIAGLAFHTYFNGAAGFGVSLGGMVFGFAVLLAPYMMGGMTNGDVKLLVAIGAWLGFPLVMIVFIVSAFAS